MQSIFRSRGEDGKREKRKRERKREKKRERVFVFTPPVMDGPLNTVTLN